MTGSILQRSLFRSESSDRRFGVDAATTPFRGSTCFGVGPQARLSRLRQPVRAVQRSQLSPICNSFQVLDATGVADDSAGRKSLNLCEATESMGGRLEVLEVLGAVSGAA